MLRTQRVERESESDYPPPDSHYHPERTDKVPHCTELKGRIVNCAVNAALDVIFRINSMRCDIDACKGKGQGLGEKWVCVCVDPNGPRWISFRISIR